MSVLSRVKQFLPPSSRSLHALWHEVGQMHDELRALTSLHGEIGDLHPRFDRLGEQVSSMDARMMMLLWELYRREGESLDDAKRRMVTQLPQATGDQRLYQLASAQLLFEFDAFCALHGLTYWLVSGTLLGAVRHGGFIPWDDDVDVGMCRHDIERIIALAADDERYEVTVRYDWYVRCRQVRFCYADRRVPCFIDLFYFDPVAELGKETYVARESERAHLEADLADDKTLESYWGPRSQFVDARTPRGQEIGTYFDAHVAALYERGVLVESLDEAAGIVWGIDNVNSGVAHHSWYLIPKEAIWPLGTLAFEGHDLCVPHDYDRCLSDIFGNIYDLPRTVRSYFNHPVSEAFNNADTREALEGLAERARAAQSARG